MLVALRFTDTASYQVTTKIFPQTQKPETITYAAADRRLFCFPPQTTELTTLQILAGYVGLVTKEFW